MSDDPQREYDAALAAFKTAQARLAEAKRHVPPSPRDLYRQRLRDERMARIAAANTPEAIAGEREVTRRALDLIRQHMTMNTAADTARALDGASIGQRLIIRMPKAQD